MCGRYSLGAEADELVETFDVPELTFEHHPRYNVAPGQDAPVVAVDRKGRRMGLMRWGFVPAWASPARRASINVRSESVADRISFKEAFRRRRCLVPADGFYEWQRMEGRATPHWFHRADRTVFSMAGLWEGHTFAILTTDAGDDVSAVHDRMPVVVEPPDRDLWLDRAASAEDVARLFRPAARGSFLSHAVSTRVNRIEQEGPSLVEPV